jgi:uncharacterized protein (TIGR02145 family)
MIELDCKGVGGGVECRNGVEVLFGMEATNRFTQNLGVMKRLFGTFCLLLLSAVLVGQVITSRRSTESAYPTALELPDKGNGRGTGSYLGDVAGLAMKSKGTRYWEANEGTTNVSGFSALPSGTRNYVGGFVLREISGAFWASTESDTSNAYNFAPSCITDGMHRDTDGKTLGYAVRCLKD